MKILYDQFSKKILSGLLQPFTQLEVGREIPGHVLVADLWVTPVPEQEGELLRLGMLGRMIAQGPCLIEPFSSPPRMRRVRTCVLRQYALDHAQYRDARRESRVEPPFPMQWLISAGRPRTVLRTMNFRPMDGWPSGFWQRDDCDALHVVVVSDLPRTPDTLYLRLLSRSGHFSEAVRELAGLHDDRAQRLRDVLIAFQREIPQNAVIEEAVMEALRSIEEVYAEWEQEVLDKGRRDGLIEGHRDGLIEGRRDGLIEGHRDGLIEGRRNGLIEAIEALCSVLDIELAGDRRQALAFLDVAELESLIIELKTTRRWPAE